MTFSLPEAKVIADSISSRGKRLTTVQVKLHRFVLAEKNTHRAFSRNSASSRAVPTKKLRAIAQNDPAMPLFWGLNQPGMQARVEAPEELKVQMIDEWLQARDHAIEHHERLEKMGLHKALVNRVIEPYLWHHAIVSATDWDNFFHQRFHQDAQPEMADPAICIYEAIRDSVPVNREDGSWHLPYVTEDEREVFDVGDTKAISAGRCALVSYLNHDGIQDPDADIARCEKLISQSPGHWSPLEHVARPWESNENHRLTANFNGWTQFRKLVEPDVDLFLPPADFRTWRNK